MAVAAASSSLAVFHRVKTTAKKGRPIELNAAVQTHICELLESALPIAVTCEASGISTSTYHAWRARGESGEKPFADFLEATTLARARAKLALVTVIREAAPSDWRAASWLLSRMIPAQQWQEEEAAPVVTIEPMPDDELAKLLDRLKAETDEEMAKLLRGRE
jgi:hypothetical protein